MEKRKDEDKQTKRSDSQYCWKMMAEKCHTGRFTLSIDTLSKHTRNVFFQNWD